MILPPAVELGRQLEEIDESEIERWYATHCGLGVRRRAEVVTPLFADVLSLADGEPGELEDACDPLERTK